MASNPRPNVQPQDRRTPDAGLRPAVTPEGGMPHSGGEPPLSDLFKQLAEDTQTLVRQELDLIRVELGQKVSYAGRNAGMTAAGGFVAYAGAIVAIVGIALLLGTFMPMWLGFLITGILVAGGGYALVQSGIKSLKGMDFSLRRTEQTMRENKQWIEHEKREIQRDPGRLGASR
jgi:hypothetical protein